MLSHVKPGSCRKAKSVPTNMEPAPPPNPPAANISKRVMEARDSDNEGEGLDAVRQTVHNKTKEVPKKKRASGTGSYDADVMSTKVSHDLVATGDGERLLTAAWVW